ncbi:hypothetical protein immuto35A_173 [Flavobacterium phage vB_FspM_immuto_3-5A]|uniref:Uncharacterized protein n=1 Tax=Flavobacterium phage vB_FspM_immuto_2-6A TaxID=2801477 RepID=A0A7T8ERP1_9CAUD|nr:hypothetical protein KNV73_gp097 [Flavobacterium phage vB_FspM_immuto_2-6A]QQO91853.1 hypothetical protein immuto26A_174 [Flavobacterium phage vB_FspM_immuto_2-6A]QQO92091.1 hypothetical protein immuto35A_173 [Flavobacterium phage vB_FspM_immuto_3-5A]QQO92329.1 hypothetical protein immuto136C_173 [Flavobacterium phage vB_FspM_immuto_13-6C]
MIQEIVTGIIVLGAFVILLDTLLFIIKPKKK